MPDKTKQFELDEQDEAIMRGLIRARREAWKLAARTGTPFITFEDGKIVRRYPKEGEPWPGDTRSDTPPSSK